MASIEERVRSAALALKTEIDAAVAAGYRVQMPARAEDLGAIAISATAKAAPPVPENKPATFGAGRAAAAPKPDVADKPGAKDKSE